MTSEIPQGAKSTISDELGTRDSSIFSTERISHRLHHSLVRCENSFDTENNFMDKYTNFYDKYSNFFFSLKGVMNRCVDSWTFAFHLEENDRS
jgi:hypothetical protein